MNNLHPLLVHFPIAFFMLYSFLELVSIKKVRELPWLIYTKTILVTAGFLGGLLAANSGEAIEHNFNAIKNIVEVHAFWAGATNVVFGIIALLYLIKVIKLNNFLKLKEGSSIQKFWFGIANIANIALGIRFLMVIAVLFGIVAVTITGAMGASIVYGPDIDPAVKFIYSKLIGS